MLLRTSNGLPQPQAALRTPPLEGGPLGATLEAPEGLPPEVGFAGCRLGLFWPLLSK